MIKKSADSELLIVGSVAFDSIETPFGKVNKTLGGSGSYFSLAASFFCRPSLVGAVGKDFTDIYRTIFSGKNIDLSGLEKTSGQTFAWGGKYSFDLNNRTTLFTKLGVFEQFRPKLSAAHKQSPFVFLGNIHPSLQMEVLSQIKKPKFVGLDTMNLWIEKAPKLLAEVLKKVNIFIINDSEARELSGEHNLLKAAKKILGLMNQVKRWAPSQRDGAHLPSTLIIKRGEYGLLMFCYSSLRVQPKQSSRNNEKIASSPDKALAPRPFGNAQGDLEQSRTGRNDKQSLSVFHLPGFPLENVTDPTGAGDSFAGGMFGYLAKTNDTGWENLKRACVAGSVMASFSVEKLGTKRLQEIKANDIARRFAEFKRLTHFEN